MKAIRIRQPAGISGLVYEEAPDVTPGLDDVLVKVAACGITHNEGTGLSGPGRWRPAPNYRVSRGSWVDFARTAESAR